MNKRLEQIPERVTKWSSGAQEDAAFVLEEIEGRIVEPGELSPEDQTKLKALREMIQNSIAEGGDYSPDDIDAMIDQMAARSAKAP